LKSKFWHPAKLFFITGVLATAFLAFCLSLPHLSKQESPPVSVDYIVVLTGDRGRIQEALKELNNHPNTPLLISGVNSKLNLKDLSPLGINQEQQKDIIRIDYAHNTIENILFILQELKQHPSAKNIYLITSNYHLFRVKKILSSLKHPYHFSYRGIHHPFNLKKLIMEGLKNINNFFILFFWNI